METDTDLPADMNAIDMAQIDAQPVVDAEPIVDAEPPTPSFLVMWTSIFQVRLTSAFIDYRNLLRSLAM